VKDAVDLLAAASVAVHVTVVVPSGKVEPEEWSQEMLGVAPLSSVAVIVYVTLAPLELVASADRGDGTLVNVGGVLSLYVTVTVNVPRPVLPWLSVAWQPTVVDPSGKVLPDAGVQLAASEPSTRSLAVAAG
jgi:hypothetical protein